MPKFSKRKPRAAEPHPLLNNWDELNRVLKEKDDLKLVRRLLDLESKRPVRRFAFCKVLRGRYRALRKPIEDMALFSEGKAPWELVP
jgi:hypothetical protein